MKRILELAECPIPFAWKELQVLDPKAEDLCYVAQKVPRGSKLHYFFKNKIQREIGIPMEKGIAYPTLIRLLSNAIAAF